MRTQQKNKLIKLFNQKVFKRFFQNFLILICCSFVFSSESRVIKIKSYSNQKLNNQYFIDLKIQDSQISDIEIKNNNSKKNKLGLGYILFDDGNPKDLLGYTSNSNRGTGKKEQPFKYNAKDSIFVYPKNHAITKIRLTLEKMVEEYTGDQPYSINTTCKVNDKYDATVEIKKTNDKIVIRSIIFIQDKEIIPKDILGDCTNPNDSKLNVSELKEYKIINGFRDGVVSNINIHSECNSSGDLIVSDRLSNDANCGPFDVGSACTIKIPDNNWINLHFDFKYKGVQRSRDSEGKKFYFYNYINKNNNAISLDETLLPGKPISLAEFDSNKKIHIEYTVNEKLRDYYLEKGEILKISNYNQIANLSINGELCIISKDENQSLKATIPDNPILIVVDLNSISKSKDEKKIKGFKEAINKIYETINNSNIHMYRYLNPFPSMHYINNLMLREIKHNVGFNGVITKENIDEFTDYYNNKSDKTIEYSNCNSESLKATISSTKETSKIKNHYWVFEKILGVKDIYVWNFKVQEAMDSNEYICQFNENVVKKDFIPSSFTKNNGKIFYLSFKPIDIDAEILPENIEYLNLKENTAEEIIDIITNN